MPKTPTPEHDLDLDGKVLLPSRINLRDSRRIRNAFSHMPFAADQRVAKHLPPFVSVRRGSTDEITVDALVNTIDALAEVVREYADRQRATTSEFDALRRDVAAFRRILGTTP